MAFNVRNYVKERLNIYNPNIDTREGSVVNDVLVAPLSIILDKYETGHNEILNKLSLNEISSMSVEELDTIGLQYLLTRKAGTVSSGALYIYFTNPVAVTVPKGTIFNNGSVDFRSTSDFFLSRSAMEQNLEEYYYYVAGPISVISVNAGDNNLPAESSFTTNYKLLLTPNKIINKNEFTGGTVTENNEQFFARIINSLDGMSLASPIAIKAAIQAYAPNISMIDVVGAGSAYMTRDLVTDLTQAGSHTKSDFFRKYFGLHTGLYDNPNIARFGVFLDTDSSSEVSFPNVASWTSEFSNSLYESIYLKNDPNFAEGSVQVHIRDFILGPNYNPDLGIFNSAAGWSVNDSISSDNKVFIIDEIAPTSNGLRLGKTKTNLPQQHDFDVRIPYKAVRNLITDVEDAVATSNDVKHAASTKAIIETLTDIIQESNINNFSPVVHHPLSQHQGIGIKCQMLTTDNTEQGETSYITVLRNNAVFAAHDGYGLAWRKQPEFLLRMNANAYGSNNAQKIADLETFYVEYGENGHTQLGGVDKKYWKYNVFLVDNNILEENVWVGNEQLWDQSNGTNQFIQAAKVWIKPNTTYWFLMYIYEAFGFEAWVGTDINNFSQANIVLSKGQSYPTYTPVSGSHNLAIDGRLDPLTYRNRFGIGVSHTHNCEWYVSNLLVWTITEVFPMHLFSFKPDTQLFDITKGINVEYYGYGYDNVLVMNDAYTHPRAKVKLGIYNYNTHVWETLGTNIYDPYKNLISSYGPLPVVLDDIKIAVTNYGTLSNYINPDTGYVQIAAAPANSGPEFYRANTADNKNHTLRSYYVSINNGTSNVVHRGNCTDIYCYDPANLQQGSTVTTLTGNTIYTKSMQGIKGHIQEILGVREYISQIDITGDKYVISNVDEGNTYSGDANFQITFNSFEYEGALIEVYYRYWSRGVEIENELINSDSRYPTADYKVKTSPAIVFNFKNLVYSGGLDLQQMKFKIKDFINTLNSSSIDKSDIINLLYQNKATYVDLNMEIELRQYDPYMKKTVKTWTTQTYSISNDPAYQLSKFYTDINELAGVVKI